MPGYARAQEELTGIIRDSIRDFTQTELVTDELNPAFMKSQTSNYIANGLTRSLDAIVSNHAQTPPAR